jgi:hypothetical protein
VELWIKQAKRNNDKQNTKTKQQDIHRKPQHQRPKPNKDIYIASWREEREGEVARKRKKADSEFLRLI